MKLYRTKTGIVIEKNDQFYLVQNENWDTFINDDKLIEKIEDLILVVKKRDDSVLEDILPPIGSQQELWACGVTYLKSKVGRQEESKATGGSDFYAKVYEAERPEVFFKSTPHRIVGSNAFVRIRKDSTWDVPEPELTLIVTSSGKIVGYTIGNDMSSRSIEGENPLYLPQAKVYEKSAALGPCLRITAEPVSPDTEIRLVIYRNGASMYEGNTAINRMKRSLTELAKYLFSECDFPSGVFLMTGTCLVPPDDFTLQKDDVVVISIDGIGTLTNTVALKESVA